MIACLHAYIYMVCVCTFVYVCMCVLSLWKSEEVIRYPEIGVIDVCELPTVWRELNPGPLQEQNMLITKEPSFQGHSL